MSKDINVKSSTIEKGLEIAKEFVGKLMNPAAEEFGLLIADKIKYFRFKNQIKILLKAKKFVEEKKLSTNLIPPKILVPLLENASLEDDDDMQDKWALLIANMSDSKSNLNNKIFPFLLGQLSKNEYYGLVRLVTTAINNPVVVKKQSSADTPPDYLKLSDLNFYLNDPTYYRKAKKNKVFR